MSASSSLQGAGDGFASEDPKENSGFFSPLSKQGRAPPMMKGSREP